MKAAETTLSNDAREPARAALLGEYAVATGDLEPGDEVLRFARDTTPFDRITTDASFVQPIAENRWAAPQGLAQRLAHACVPNCKINSRLMVVACSRVPAGSRLTLDYNSIPESRWELERDRMTWPPAWTFECQCGSRECQRRINGFRVVRSATPIARTDNLEVRAVAGKGRGVFARRGFAPDEIIECCPVIAMPEDQWEPLDRTRLESYLYKWGQALEGAACVLGYGCLYNHSFTPNAIYRRAFEEEIMHFAALREISAGEEIQINYNGNPQDQTEVWFAPVG